MTVAVSVEVKADMHKEMQKGLAMRIGKVKDQVGGARELKERTGISQSYISRLINGVVESPGVQQLLKIAEAGNVSVDYLLTGISSDERIAVPVSDLERDRSIYFDKSFLERVGLSPEKGRVFIYQGDTLNNYQPGDALLVNVDNPRGDGIYLVDFGSGISVRRLSWMPGGKVNVISDNYGANLIDAEELVVVGKVVWAGIRQ